MFAELSQALRGQYALWQREEGVLRIDEKVSKTRSAALGRTASLSLTDRIRGVEKILSALDMWFQVESVAFGSLCMLVLFNMVQDR